jgi:deoxyribodipyrimidine photo-lyase
MKSPGKHHRIIVWMRRAIRVDDNAALWHAVQDADEVIPLLVLGENPSYSIETPRRRFIRQAISEADVQLRDRGSHLHLRIGNPEREIPAAAQYYGATAVYAASLYDEPGLKRDATIGKALRGMGVQFECVKDRVLRESHEVVTESGRPYKVFTPYKRRWLSIADELPRPYPDVGGLKEVPDTSGSTTLDRIWSGGNGPRFTEADAPSTRLSAFLKASVSLYDQRRDLPAIDGTSRLSHHLALGTLSPRTVYWAAIESTRTDASASRAGVTSFISELIWREFFYQIMAAYPIVLRTSFKEDFRGIQWLRSTAAFEHWKTGMTGMPIVDAGMRQLNHEGWMHNRVRMIVASFLTKDLHISWQWGERYFKERLLDLDLAANNGGWQWTAGTGTDASPWFRIFNPVTQAKKFDPEGTYVRKYVPELARIPAGRIHEPWKLTHQDQQAYGSIIGRQYPRIRADHSEERLVAARMYSTTQRH